jgi:hypothetical protein
MNLSDLFGLSGGGSSQPAATISDEFTGMPAPLGTDPNTGMPSAEHPYIRTDPATSSSDKKTAASTDRWKSLANQLQMATSIAQLGRGMYGDLSKGPTASPIAAPRIPQAAAFQPTAYGAYGAYGARGSGGVGGLRLSDLLARG